MTQTSVKISQKAFRVVVLYGNERRMMVVNPNRVQEVLPVVISIFGITTKVKILLKSLNAEVFSTAEIFEGDELVVIGNEEESKRNSNEEHKSQQEEIKIEINLDPISGKKFKGKELLRKLNDWSSPLQFGLIFPNGTAKQENKWRRTVWCCVKGCDFKLYFNADFVEGKHYDELDFSLESGKNNHNHSLNSSEDTMSLEIIKEIDRFKGKMKTKVELQKYINEKFEKKIYLFSNIPPGYKITQ